jgi:8-oxo-dGTP pyrophosphatase MutT (NUDIX family)
VAVLLVNADGEVLMQLRDSMAAIAPNQWATVGGRLDPGEDPETGARRELLEETGLTVDGPLTLVAFGVWPASHGTGVTEWHVYAARTTTTNRDVVVGEGEDIVFLRPDVVLGLDLGVSAARIVPAFIADQYAAFI